MVGVAEAVLLRQALGDADEAAEEDSCAWIPAAAPTSAIAAAISASVKVGRRLVERDQHHEVEALGSLGDGGITQSAMQVARLKMPSSVSGHRFSSPR